MLKPTLLSDALKPLLPRIFFDAAFLNIELWQWAIAVVLFGLAFFLSWVVTKLCLKVTYRIIIRQIPTFDKKILRVAFTPLRVIFWVALFALGVLFLDLDERPNQFVATALKLFAVFAFTWLVFRVVDVFSQWMAERLQEKGKISMIAMLPLGRRATKTAVAILAILTTLQNLGIHVTALIAGLGVGGIAVALAAQKTLENLFGGVMLILDQPVRVGDDCRFGTQRGVIEDIGLRTTKIRTPERTIVSVPNSDFSQMQLENFAARDRIRLICTIGLRYESTPDQVRHVLIKIRELIYRHPKMDSDPVRVRLVALNSYSLDIEIFAYALTSDMAEFSAIREDIFLRVMDIVKESGTAFAFPSQTTYLTQDRPLDLEVVSSVENTVALWREKNELSMPEFSASQIDELDDTLDYPPKGSVVKK